MCITKNVTYPNSSNVLQAALLMGLFFAEAAIVSRDRDADQVVVLRRSLPVVPNVLN